MSGQSPVTTPEAVAETTALYRRVAQIPAIRSGSLRRITDDAYEACWVSEALDFENNAKVGWEKRATVISAASSAPSQWQVLASAAPGTVVDGKAGGYLSPSGALRLVVGANGATGDEFAISVYNRNGFVYRIPVGKTHGALFPSPFFQNVTWSSDEQRVAYVAERVIAPAGQVWAPTASTTRSAFESKQSMGEGMKDTYHLSVFECNLFTSTVREVVPSDFAATYWLSGPVYTSGDRTLLFNAAPYFPERLGLAHCATRPNRLFEVDVDGATTAPAEPVEIKYPDGIECTRNLRVRGNRAVCFVPTPGCKAHSCTYSLWTLDTTTKEFACVVPLVTTPIASHGFPGFYSCTGNDIFWFDDSSVIVQSPRRSSCVVYQVNVATGALTQLVGLDQAAEVVGNWSVLDVRGSLLLLSYSTAVVAPVLYVYDGATKGLTVIDTSSKDAQARLFSASYKTRILTLGAQHHDTEVLVHQPVDVPVAVRPTVLFVHGGPHANDTNSFMANIFFLLALGYDVASVNYGGSTGFGQTRLEELLGHVGVNDVADCIAALDAVAPQGRVVVSGGSHGGFLAAHLSSRYTERFAASIMRNPVINITSCYWESDISDWCLAESGLEEANVQVFYEHSPIQYASKLRTPTLIGIGLDDLRVPPPQGRSWYYAVRRAQVATPEAARTPIRMIEYPSTGHAMDSSQAQIDFQVHAALFMKAHV